MGNCLVTKLKENVQNDDLQTFNTIILDLVDVSSQHQITIGAANGSVTVTFADAVHQDSTSGTELAANTPLTITGKRKSFYLKSGQSAKIGFLKIENIYNLESLICTNGLDVNATVKSGLLSLAYAPNLVQFGGIMSALEVTNCKKVRIGANNANAEYSIGGNNIQKIVNLGTSPFVTSLPNSVRYIQSKYKGDVKDWPVQLRYYAAGTGMATGELNDYIAKAVAAGRTSGYVALLYANNGQYQVNITLNGVSLKNNPSAVVLKNISNQDIVIIQWNGTSNVSFATSKPQDFIDNYDVADSDFTWQPYE